MAVPHLATPPGFRCNPAGMHLWSLVEKHRKGGDPSMLPDSFPPPSGGGSCRPSLPQRSPSAFTIFEESSLGWTSDHPWTSRGGVFGFVIPKRMADSPNTPLLLPTLPLLAQRPSRGRPCGFPFPLGIHASPRIKSGALWAGLRTGQTRPN